jgi:hypothetical protein
MRLLIQVGENLVDDQGVFSASASCVALPRASLHSDTGDDFARTATLGAGFIGHIPVPDRSAAICDCANRLSCRFVDVDIA